MVIVDLAELSGGGADGLCEAVFSAELLCEEVGGGSGCGFALGEREELRAVEWCCYVVVPSLELIARRLPARAPQRRPRNETRPA